MYNQYFHVKQLEWFINTIQTAKGQTLFRFWKGELSTSLTPWECTSLSLCNGRVHYFDLAKEPFTLLVQRKVFRFAHVKDFADLNQKRVLYSGHAKGFPNFNLFVHREALRYICAKEIASLIKRGSLQFVRVKGSTCSSHVKCKNPSLWSWQ